MDNINLLDFFLSDFVNPKKRVFTGYLILSVLLAFLWLILIKRHSLNIAVKKIFDKKIIWSGSAKADYKLFLINRIFTFFISPLLISQVAISTAIYLFLHSVEIFNQNLFVNTPSSLIIALFTISLFIVDDFTKYFVHRWMHKIPLLWAIHKVHHSAKTMTPITVYRVHPIRRSAVFFAQYLRSRNSYSNIFVFFRHCSGSLYSCWRKHSCILFPRNRIKFAPQPYRYFVLEMARTCFNFTVTASSTSLNCRRAL